MRIITLNANGIRSAARKGFFEWMQEQDADLVCIQETKAQEHQLRDDPLYYPAGYHCFYEDATAKKGYSGVAIYCRRAPDEVIRGLGFDEFDPEGRYLEARFGNLSVASLYLPSGSSSEVRQAAKFRFHELYMTRLKSNRSDGRDYIVCGDWNTAHQNIDLKNWRGNQKNSGFLPEERAWLGELFSDAGYGDAFRVVNQEADQYTWWSNRGQAWAKNVGWRIDYQVVSGNLMDTVRSASIYKEQRFSDHAPLIMDYDYPL